MIFAVMLLGASMALRASTDTLKYTYVPVSSWEFTNCRSIEVGTQFSMLCVNNNILIADSSFNKAGDKRYVRELTQSGKLVRKWGDFQNPCGIVRDKAGNYYILDRRRVKIYKYSPERKLIKSWGSKGSGEGQMGFTSGLAIDANDRLYVADKSNKRISRFNTNGDFLSAFGDSVLTLPMGLVVDGKGTLWVADKDRIVRFDMSGKYIDSLVLDFPDVTVASIPTIARSHDGEILVGAITDTMSFIFGFTSGGELISASLAAAPAQKGYGASPKDLYGGFPAGICVIGDKMYVVDEMKYRVMVLKKSKID